MKQSLIITVASALVLAAAVQAGEDEGGKHKPKHNPQEMRLVPPRLSEKLNLTDDQQAQLKEIEAAYDKERDAWFVGKRDQMAARDAQARDARKAENEAQLKEVRKQRHELMQPLVALRKQHVDKVRGILTEEQKQTLDKSREEFKKRREKHGDKDDAPPPPAE